LSGGEDFVFERKNLAVYVFIYTS